VVEEPVLQFDACGQVEPFLVAAAVDFQPFLRGGGVAVAGEVARACRPKPAQLAADSSGTVTWDRSAVRAW